MKEKMLKNPWIKKILQAVLIVAAGFILLNFTFLFDWVFQSFIRFVFYPSGESMNMVGWLAPFQHFLFVVLIGFITWLIFRTKWPVLVKAIYLSVPTAVVLVTVGMFTANWLWLSYSLGGLLTLATLYVFYRTKQPWQYYFGVIWVTIALVIMALTGAEI